MEFSNYSDQDLIALLKSGKIDAFNEIYNRYSAFLYRFAFNILKDEDECVDAIQEVFVWFWKNREKVEVRELKAYLCAAVKYKIARIIHNSKRKAEILKATPEMHNIFVDDSLELKELKDAIKAFISTLPPKAREIFQLSRNEYLNNKEIALRLGISEKTVENQLTISLKKLKNSLGKNSFFFILL